MSISARILIVCSLLFNSSLLKAQSSLDKKRDSLFNIYINAATDTAQVWAMMELGKLYLEGNPDSAFNFIQKANDLAEKLSFKRGIAKTLINGSYALNNLSKYKEAIKQLEAAIPICEQMNMRKELVAAYNNLGNAWSYHGNLRLATHYYEKSLEAMKGTELPPFYPIVVGNNLSRLYIELSLFEKAEKLSSVNYEKSMAMRDTVTATQALEHLGIALKNLKKEKEALSAFQKSIELCLKVGVPIVEISTYSNIGDILQDSLEAEAEKYYLKGIDLARKQGFKTGLMHNLHGLSNLRFKQKNWGEAELFAQNALDIANETGDLWYATNLYHQLSYTGLIKGDMEGWEQNKLNYFSIRDSMAHLAVIHSLEELEIKYETEKKVQQITQLEKDKQLQELRIQRQRGLIIGSIVFLILLLITGILIWRNLEHRKKLLDQELFIKQQKIKELEQENQLSITKAMLQGQEKERTRLARDLHDGLGGMLSGIKQSLFAMKGNQIISEAGVTTFNQTIEDMNKSINELRNIARNMMPEALLRFGLKDALQDYCDHLKQGGNIEVHFQAFGMGERLPEQTEVILFRIAQELLNNAIKHAKPSKVLLQVIKDQKRINLTVEDDGKGFDIDRFKNSKGVGWMNIQSRVNYLNGRLDVRSVPEEGTSITIEINLE